MSQRTFQKLVYNRTGQTLEWYPPDALVIQYGAPASAATYTVFAGSTSNDGTSEFSGTATAEYATVNYTLGAAAGYSQANRRQATLSSNVANITQRYLLGNVSTQREIATLIAFAGGAGTKVATFDNDLQFDYPSGTSTFQGLRQTFTVDATFIATLAKINVFATLPEGYFRRGGADYIGPAPPYRVRWVYSLNSITREDWTYFDVVRQAGSHHVTLADLQELWPGALNQDFSEQRGLQYARQIDAAWDEFCFDVRCAGHDVDAIIEGPMVDQMIRQLAIALICEARDIESNTTTTVTKDARDRYTAMFKRSLEILHVWMSIGSTGEITVDAPSQPFLRR